MKDLYDYSFKYNYKKQDKVTYNKKIFKRCPFKVNEVKQINKTKDDFIGLEGIKLWWNWWELVPKNRFKKIVYCVKFYHWYYTRYKRI
ncbi:hypothetical protein [Metaclostridioides mangenotii]|uniref:hypothetical protein n=1 Tax=Metaclostridioides mangenotii TaxID=1540 RepID=UPI0004665E5B|nr:hypothetical protein [Clostridioides mangenotii]